MMKAAAMSNSHQTVVVLIRSVQARQKHHESRLGLVNKRLNESYMFFLLRLTVSIRLHAEDSSKP